jgi:hypothetical protein
MFRRPAQFIALSSALLLLSITGCTAGSDRALQSISISPNTGSGAAASYTATGTFSSPPLSVTPLSVSWLVMGPGLDPPGPGYTLTPGAFLAQRCSQVESKSATNYVVVAYAPTNPNAPSSGPMPAQVFQDLVTAHTMASEGGFVAATATLTCP